MPSSPCSDADGAYVFEVKVEALLFAKLERPDPTVGQRASDLAARPVDWASLISCLPSLVPELPRARFLLIALTTGELLETGELDAETNGRAL